MCNHHSSVNRWHRWLHLIVEYANGYNVNVSSGGFTITIGRFTVANNVSDTDSYAINNANA